MTLLALLAAPALAGGYYYSDSGIVATGRGGAWVAGADTQFAQAYNPAGLIRIDAPTINIGLSEVQQNVRFRRMRPEGATADEGEFYPEVRNEASPFEVPQLGFATPIGDRVALAVGFYSPFAPSSLYEEEGPQRYTIKDTLIYQFSVGPSVAVRVHDMLVLGAGVQWQYLQLGEELDITVSGQDDPAGDIAVEAQVFDRFTLNANFGLLFEPIEQLSVGLSVQPGTRFEATGDGTLDFSGNVFEPMLNESVYTDEVSLAIALPLVLRAGVAVRPIPGLEIEPAVVWQGWSSLEDIVIEDVDITVDTDSPLIPPDARQVADSFTLPAGLKDTTSFRLGGEYRLIDELELRAGGFFETSALSPQEVSVALVDTNKWQVGAGASVFLLEERLRFDLAGAFLIFEDLEIRDSTVTQIDAGVIPGTTPEIVGNGDLWSRGWVLGAQAQWSFRKG